jgi:hypothetical protein
MAHHSSSNWQPWQQPCYSLADLERQIQHLTRSLGREEEKRRCLERELRLTKQALEEQIYLARDEIAANRSCLEKIEEVLRSFGDSVGCASASAAQNASDLRCAAGSLQALQCPPLPEPCPEPEPPCTHKRRSWNL